jgi:copper transport protein
VDTDLSYWTILAAASRWALYTLMLIASGSALFVLLTPIPIRLRDAASSVGRHASLCAAFSYLASVGLGGAEMMAGGPETLWSPDTWSLAATTSLGHSAALGIPAMLLLWGGHSWNLRPLWWLGALGGIASFLLTGHAATANPPVLAATAVAIHLAGAAYWIGALYPLHRGLRDLDPASSAGAIAAFSYRAVAFVAAIVVSGIVISWIQLAAPAALISTQYGYRLMAKVALFGALLLLAAYNKLILTPRIEGGVAEARQTLRRIIVIEYTLIVLILGAAVSLTLVEPPRAQAHTAGAR